MLGTKGIKPGMAELDLESRGFDRSCVLKIDATSAGNDRIAHRKLIAQLHDSDYKGTTLW